MVPPINSVVHKVAGQAPFGKWTKHLSHFDHVLHLGPLTDQGINQNRHGLLGNGPSTFHILTMSFCGNHLGPINWPGKKPKQTWSFGKWTKHLWHFDHVLLWESPGTINWPRKKPKQTWSFGKWTKHLSHFDQVLLWESPGTINWPGNKPKQMWSSAKNNLVHTVEGQPPFGKLTKHLWHFDQVKNLMT